MTEPNGTERSVYLSAVPVAWSAVPLAQALAAYPPADDDGAGDVGWQAVHWQPRGEPENGVPRGTGVGVLARRLIARERARLRRRAPMALEGRRNGHRAGSRGVRA